MASRRTNNSRPSPERARQPDQRRRAGARPATPRVQTRRPAKFETIQANGNGQRRPVAADHRRLEPGEHLQIVNPQFRPPTTSELRGPSESRPQPLGRSGYTFDFTCRRRPWVQQRSASLKCPGLRRRVRVPGVQYPNISRFHRAAGQALQICSVAASDPSRTLGAFGSARSPRHSGGDSDSWRSARSPWPKSSSTPSHRGRGFIGSNFVRTRSTQHYEWHHTLDKSSPTLVAREPQELDGHPRHTFVHATSPTPPSPRRWSRPPTTSSIRRRDAR